MKNNKEGEQSPSFFVYIIKMGGVDGLCSFAYQKNWRKSAYVHSC